MKQEEDVGRAANLIILASWLLLIMGAIGCRTVSKASQKTTVDSTAKTEVRISQTTNKDSTAHTVSKDSTTTNAASEYERETVIEEYAGLNFELSGDSLKTSPLQMSLPLVRRTTIKEKGKDAIVITDSKSKDAAAHTITSGTFDSAASAEVAVKAESQSKTVTRAATQSLVWNLLLFLLIAGLLYWGWRRFKG